MKIVDEKGKIFGKINIIDLLAILVLAAALVFLAVRVVNRGAGDPANAQTTKLTYTARVNSVAPEVYNEVLRQIENAGGADQLMASGDLLPAYITKVEAVPHLLYDADADGNVTPHEETGENARVDLIFTVEAQVEDPVTNLVGTQEVRVAKNHILKTVHFEFPYATIITCDWG